jgi:monovalent cation/proton antiporter MnhG/PhaG subunit
VKTSDVLVDVFLTVGVAAQLVSCLGVVVFPNVFDRLHFVGAGSTLGPLFVGAAVLTRYTTSAGGISTIVTMAVLVLFGPMLVVAAGRAAHRIELGTVEATEAEKKAG